LLKDPGLATLHKTTNMNSDYLQSVTVVADASVEERGAFIRKTYGHLAAAVLAFVGLEWALFQTPLPETALNLLARSGYSWLIVMVAFMAISWIAEKWARSSASKGMQYAGLGLYVVAEALIFLPLLVIASRMAKDIIPISAVITLLLFAGLTFTAFTTKTDFSFLGGILRIGSFVALGVIVASIIFGFSLGLIFSSIMVLFAAAAILYSTSNIIHHYHTSQYVAASLSLFASIALLFWYVIRILMSLTSRD
jgi:hypothetical protein